MRNNISLILAFFANLLIIVSLTIPSGIEYDHSFFLLNYGGCALLSVVAMLPHDNRLTLPVIAPITIFYCVVIGRIIYGVPLGNVENITHPLIYPIIVLGLTTVMAFFYKSKSK